MKNLFIIFVACFAVVTARNVEFPQPTCVSIIENELDNIPMGVWENIESCAKTVANAVLELGADLTESTSDAVINALKFKDIVLKCYNAGGKVSQAACVVSNVVEIKNRTKQVISDATELISILKEKGTVLVDAVKSCHLRDTDVVFYQIELVAAKMNQCPAF